MRGTAAPGAAPGRAGGTMAVGTGTSLALSSLLSLLLFAGMQMYSRQLASTEWLTIQGGLLGSALFVCSLTASLGTAEGPQGPGGWEQHHGGGGGQPP
ncbi:keratinocyte-associated protein 2 [Onychostruthus taczanowskii]|uniref:keratinocyte-associated protein 2 n=1 Tax=Onychostruthus taczanowskii TaxID=356909 RepID=UPI001B804F5C|nr:keratinocyte-associated protein 2 [Onychostruthus taczanowskii]